MATFHELQRAARNRVCPYCVGNLKLLEDDEGPFLLCVNGHAIPRYQDAPLRSVVDRLQREGELVTAPLRVGQRSVASDMAELYG